MATLLGIVLGCGTGDIGSARPKKVNAIATQKYGSPYDLLPNANNEFILCIKHEKETTPLRPIKFFLYDVQKDSILYEREIDNGTVEWMNASQFSIKQIPGNITGNEPPDAFTEIYDIPSGKILSR